jgi:hypothetical protein
VVKLEIKWLKDYSEGNLISLWQKSRCNQIGYTPKSWQNTYLFENKTRLCTTECFQTLASYRFHPSSSNSNKSFRCVPLKSYLQRNLLICSSMHNIDLMIDFFKLLVMIYFLNWNLFHLIFLVFVLGLFLSMFFTDGKLE